LILALKDMFRARARAKRVHWEDFESEPLE
jgi:hypothetical protein